LNTKTQFDGRRLILPALMGAVMLAAVFQYPVRAAEPGFLSNLGLLDRLTRSAVAAAADSLRLPPGEPVSILSQTWHEANWFVGNKMAEELTRRGHPVRVLEWSREGDTPPRPKRAVQGERQPAGEAPGGREGAAPDGPDLPDDLNGGDAQAFADSVQAYADSVAAASFDPLWGEMIDDEGQDPPTPAAPEPPRREPPRREGVDPPAQSDAAWTGLDDGAPLLPDGHVVDLRIVEFGVQYSDVGRRFLFGPLQFTRVGGIFLQASHIRGPEGTIRRMTNAERHHVDRLSGSDRHLAEGASYPFSQPELQAPSLGRYVEPAVVVSIVTSLIYLFYANQN